MTDSKQPQHPTYVTTIPPTCSKCGAKVEPDRDQEGRKDAFCVNGACGQWYSTGPE